MSEHESFTLEAADGSEANYRVMKVHDPIARGQGVSGLRLVQDVVRTAGTPIAEVLNTNVGSLVKFIWERGKEGKAVDKEAVMRLFEEADAEDLEGVDLELPSAWSAFCDAMEHVQFETLLPAVLHHTVRNGKPLKKEDNFNTAYAGNYMEAVKAAYKVARINGFFGSLATQLDEM